MEKRTHTLVIAFVAIMLSIIAVCLAICRIEPITIDWMGILVGILSTLTVVLISWQIYTLFDIRKIRKEVEAERLHVIYESERNSLISSMSMSDFYYSSLIKEPEEQRIYKYISYRLYAILHASRIGDFATCGANAKVLMESITKETKLRKIEKEYLFETISQIGNNKSIDRFNELVNTIGSIGVY
jgi:hypothetical protein